MRRLVILAVLLLAASCGGGVNTSPTFPTISGDFSLSDVSTLGGGKLVAAVTGDAAAPVVIISVENAKDLTGAYFMLNYPDDKCHATEVEFSSLLGRSGDTISLGIIDRAGIVPAGIVMVHPESAKGIKGSGEIARISFAPGGASQKSVSTAPNGAANKPADLTILETGTPGTYQLMWHEMHVGDYDNNGTVNISDITPIAMHYGHLGNADEVDELITGGEGRVGVSNITGIAMNFGTVLEGYNVYVAGDPNPRPNTNTLAPYSVMRPVPPPAGRVPYSFLLDLASETEVRVRPCDTDGNEGVESDPAIPGTGNAPEAPSGLVATANENVGVGAIRLSWNANTETDLLQYRVYRRDGPTGDFNQIGVVSAGAIPLTFNDNNASALLTAGVDYTYYLTAVNTASMDSEPSAEATATPFYPGPPTTPTSITVTGEGIPYSYAIEIKWGPSTSSYLEGYEIWRKGPGDADFIYLQNAGAVGDRTIYDTGLTEGQTYIYKVRAYDQFDQFSGFTSEAGTTPNTHIPLVINSVNTDNTTLTIGSTTEKAHLSVDMNNPAANVTWTASAGSFDSTTSKTPTYSPPATGTAQKVTITVTASDGIDNLQDTVDAILTTMPVHGPAFDFSKPCWTAPNTPYLAFGTYLDDGNVILLDMGGYWCTYCKRELPFLDTLLINYGPAGYYGISCWDEDKTLDFLKDYFDTNGWDPTELYQDSGEEVFNLYSSAYNGGEGGHPMHYLIDRDKDVRKAGIGAIDGAGTNTEWENAVKELVGVS